jgi:ectoine hydroxylase-related dioxygenase (phytanoyl-CoA dioxygenase family)
VAQFDEAGFVVVPDVFDAATLAAVTADTDRFEAEVDAFLASQADGRISIAESGAITFSTHLVARSPQLAAFARHPFFLGACADLVGPDVNLYWDQAVYKKPEKPRRFPWHQDNGYAYVEPQQYLTCWVALTDATAANGCPQVARGLHRAGTLAHTYVDPLGWECLTDPDDVAVAEVGAGGVVVFSSLTPHLTGPNTTEGVRKAYILQYAPAGATVMTGDPKVDAAPTGRAPADNPDWQFPVLRDGEAVA